MLSKLNVKHLIKMIIRSDLEAKRSQSPFKMGLELGFYGGNLFLLKGYVLRLFIDFFCGYFNGITYFILFPIEFGIKL